MKNNMELISKLLSLRFLKYDNTEGGYTALFMYPDSGEIIHLPKKLVEHIANRFSEPEVLNQKVKTLLK